MGWFHTARRALFWPRLAPLVEGPAALALVPALCLAAYWFGGEGALIVLAALVPSLCLLGGGLKPRRAAEGGAGPGLCPGAQFPERVATLLARASASDGQSALFLLSLDDSEALIRQHGQAAADLVLTRSGERLCAALRRDDCVSPTAESGFAICTAPLGHLDLELCLQLAGRFQATLEEPILLDGTAIYATFSIGFCSLARAPAPEAGAWQAAARAALHEAQRRGPSAIRAYAPGMARATETDATLRSELRAALDGGAIRPWFQPQISTDTGQITGFEALARWDHPERGLLPPADFLPDLAQAGLLERLGELVLYHAFAALRDWDRVGLAVPCVGVNFDGDELGNPHLVQKIQWELDRFDLTPDRLAVEVLETVVAAAPDDMITRNINALGALGCRIDLDDFGTGQAAIAAIRRFSVSRIKIDRSFVLKADRDPDQRRMISAILTMAERLEVETLAEGVETVGEHLVLSQLGCHHVQGYGIARPMSFEETEAWIRGHQAKLEEMPRILSSGRG